MNQLGAFIAVCALSNFSHLILENTRRFKPTDRNSNVSERKKNTTRCAQVMAGEFCNINITSALVSLYPHEPRNLVEFGNKLHLCNQRYSRPANYLVSCSNPTSSFCLPLYRPHSTVNLKWDIDLKHTTN